ncbi:MAG TPA: amidohydrolase [Anaerolineales bacterium]|jgi:amidohydrolase
MTDFYEEAKSLFPYSQAIRRDLHMHPELGFQEVRTSALIARELREIGLEVSTGFAKTGLTAMIDGEKPGPVIMLRFDIDALPIEEQTGAAYASQNPGLMHACGHDGHVAIGLTVARLLNDHRAELAGSVKLLFQPAEEGAGGAETMIKDGALADPAPLRCLGLHIWNEKPLGWLGIAGGPVMASAAMFVITLTGKGGHAAMPHHTVDPMVAAAQIISAAQTISSRNVDPQKACVVSFCTLQAGDAFNVIPHTVELRGTIRTFEPEVEQLTYKRLEEIASGVGGALGCKVEFSIQNPTPAVINDPTVAAAVQRAARSLLPDHELDESGRFTMGAEDFAFYQQKIPGAFFFIGSTNQQKGFIYGHHHPKFDFDEAALPRGAALMTQAAIELLRS